MFGIECRTQMVCRVATLEDLPAIRELIPVSVRGLSRDLYTTEQIESALVHVFGPDTQLIMDGTYFVVEKAEKLIGCGGWSRRAAIFGGDQMKGAVDPLLEPTRDAARVRAFFVHPEWARRGIGTLLLKASAEGAERGGFSTLELVGTLPGERLYRQHGFELVERIQHPLEPGLSIEWVRMRAPVKVVLESLAAR